MTIKGKDNQRQGQTQIRWFPDEPVK